MSDDLRRMRGLTRERTYAIWQLAQAGVPLEGEEATIAQALLGHPEYYEIWNRIPELGDEEIESEGANPFLHVTIHSAVENQLAAGDPSSVVHAFRRLARQGLSRHEVIHRLGSVLAQEIWDMMRDHRPIDPQEYNRAMRRLGRKGPTRTKQAARRRKRRKKVR